MASTVAVSVFGKPITQGTRAERAQAAAKNRNAGGKLDQLLQASLDFEKTAAAAEEVNSDVVYYNYHDNARIGGLDHVNSANGHYNYNDNIRIGGFNHVNSADVCTGFGGLNHVNSADVCTGFGGFDHINNSVGHVGNHFPRFNHVNSAGHVGNHHHSRQRRRTVRNNNDGNRTTCIIYNATGDPITYVTKHDWEGNVAGRIPVVIQNGQYALLKHIGGTATRNAKGSIGAMVFNVQNYTDCMIAWNNPKKTTNGEKNTAYCKMDDPGHFNHCDWKKMYHVVRDCKSECETSMEGFTTTVSINAEGSIPQYRAEFELNAR